ncbi:MAG: LysM peptidoglycan-binding domain-containing protein [Lentimicrobiaceae bacterium]|nr:LysM peptidoglycan-binding domain-containing protein [Lentimicrobiaceae bacterium]
MKTIKTEPNQTIYDIAVQYYGTLDGVEELMTLNPDIKNDTKALVALGINTANQDHVFRFDVAIAPGSILVFNETSKTIDSRVVKKIEQPITTYQIWQER